jgi:DNA-binding transcriptional LysR family regulator
MATLQRSIRLSQLRLLVAIAQEKSLLRAAKSLHMTQPAATKMLRQLESALNENLVTRGPVGSVLTPSGQMLCRRARLILAELSDAEAELGLWHSGGAGHVVIGALPVATPMLIPEALKALVLIAPRVTVEVIEGASNTMFHELLAGSIDMLVGRVWPREEPDVMTDVLYESNFQLYSRAEHPLANQKRVTLKDAVAYPWILPPPSAHTRGVIEDMFRQAGLNLPVHPVETSSYQVTRALILDTDVLVPLPIEVLQAEYKQGLVSRLPIAMDLRLPPIGIVRNSKRTLSPAALAVIEQIKKVGEGASSIYGKRK